MKSISLEEATNGYNSGKIILSYYNSNPLSREMTISHTGWSLVMFLYVPWGSKRKITYKDDKTYIGVYPEVFKYFDMLFELDDFEVMEFV